MPTGYKMTHDEFINRVAKLLPNVKVVGQFTRQRDKIACECQIDENKWSPRAGDLLNGHGCPKCKGRINRERCLKTHKQFVAEVAKILPDVEILSRYTGAHNDITCRCKIHNCTWTTKALVLTQGSGCTKCGYEKLAQKLRTRTEAEFLEELYALDSNIIVVTPFVNMSTPLHCRCAIDDYEWDSTGSRLLRGDGCPKCSGKAKVTQEEFIVRMSAISPDIEIIGTYLARHTNVQCKCRVCEHEWEATPGNLYAGWGCPSCSRSRGERAIEQYLRKHEIDFKTEYSFEDCRYIHPLLFDFYLPEVSTIIEYDGEQHFRPVKFGGANDDKADERFELSQIRDNIKNDYCEKHGIRMIRIPYTDFDHIEEILDELIA